MDKIKKVQKYLKEQNIDGWLLYYFDNNNSFALDFLEVAKDQHLSRRFFYWIPKEGDPIQLVHAIEPDALANAPGIKRIYQRWELLQSSLQEILEGAKIVAMEYSSCNRLPYISKVDAGTVEMVKKCHVDVVSSAPFLQYFTSVMTESQETSQKEAGQILHHIAEEAFVFLEKCLEQKKAISEYELQKWIVQKIEEHDLTIDGHFPICAFGIHTADPHYTPAKEGSFILELNQPILLDIVARQKDPKSIYGDITRMGFSGATPPKKLVEMFELALKAQNDTFCFIQSRLQAGKIVKGYEADKIARDVIEKAGFGKYFTHRTGHNIYQTLHGPGTHLDGFETMDDRPLIANTCFTIEPGIYLPNDMGVRVEYDVIIHANGKLEITSGIQDSIRTMV